MPKIVDHNAQRQHIINHAIPLFRRLGYHGLGMRQIARELGVSKSSLYHYFPSKQALFEACSEQITTPQLPSLPPEASSKERFELLVHVAQQLDADFSGELSLLLDYIRPMTREETQADALIQRALDNILQTLAGIVGEQHAKAALTQLLGILTMRLFTQHPDDFELLRSWCK